MPISPDAILAGGITVALAWTAGLWKLATMLAEVRGQVRHNGGSSLKDDARKAAVESVAAREAALAAREVAAKVATDLVAYRGHQAEEATEQREAIAAVQHDVTNLLDRQDKLDDRVTSHGERNRQQVALLQAAVDAGAARDAALRAALHESLDLAIAVQEATGEEGTE